MFNHDFCKIATLLNFYILHNDKKSQIVGSFSLPSYSIMVTNYIVKNERNICNKVYIKFCKRSEYLSHFKLVTDIDFAVS